MLLCVVMVVSGTVSVLESVKALSGRLSVVTVGTVVSGISNIVVPLVTGRVTVLYSLVSDSVTVVSVVRGL